jgi:hypothetical protein
MAGLGRVDVNDGLNPQSESQKEVGVTAVLISSHSKCDPLPAGRWRRANDVTKFA